MPLTKARAYELLFSRRMHRRTFGRVWDWLERLGVPLRDRADVAQTVIIAAWTSWHTYDPLRARPERWLNRIAVNFATRYHERAYLWREELLPGHTIEGPDPAPLAIDLMISEQERLRFWDLVHTLDPDLRYVLVAHEIDAIPMTEIADKLGMPLSTAYKRRARALSALEATAREAEYD